MGRVSGFLRVPIGDKARLLVATCLLLITRVGLFVVSFSRFRRLLLAPTGPLARVVVGSPPPGRIAWAVDAADRALPGERTCLMRSLSAEWLHRCYGHRIVHRIGVDKADSFEAHSWIESEGEVILGDLEDLSRFESLPPLTGGEES